MNAAMQEPAITINGRALTSAQAMAVRVAVSNFHSEMDALGTDDHGLKMAAAYRERLTEVLQAMLSPEQEGPKP